MDFQPSETQAAARAAIEQIAGGVGAGEALPPWRSIWGRLLESGLVELISPDPQLPGSTGIEACEILRGLGHLAAHVPLLGAAALAPVLQHDSPPAVRDAWLPVLRSGRRVVTAAVCEIAVSTLAETRMRATETAGSAGEWAVTGDLIAVPFATEADRLVLWAAGPDGELGVFLVDPSAPGVRLTPSVATTGEAEHSVGLDAVVVRADDVVVAPGRTGTRAARRLCHHLLVGLAAEQLGLAEAALQMTARYVSSREQFGQPIGAFQAVQTRAADAYIDLEAMRWTMYHAAEALYGGDDAGADVSTAKFWACEGGAHVLAAAVHLHGGIGVDTSYPLHRYFLRAKRVEFMLGGTGTQLALLWDALAMREALVD